MTTLKVAVGICVVGGAAVVGAAVVGVAVACVVLTTVAGVVLPLLSDAVVDVVVPEVDFVVDVVEVAVAWLVVVVCTRVVVGELTEIVCLNPRLLTGA